MGEAKGNGACPCAFEHGQAGSRLAATNIESPVLEMKAQTVQHNRATKRRLTIGWASLLVALMALCAHLPNLWGYFFIDDFWHLDNLISGDYVFSLWRTTREQLAHLWFMNDSVFPAMGGLQEIVLYFRPLYVVSLWLDYHLFGFSPFGYHLHSLLWHVLNAVLLLHLLRRFRFSLHAAFIGALIFAVHPLAIESVNWISARSGPMATAFLLAALHAYLKYRESGKRVFALWHTLFAVAALFCHEHAMAYPFALVAYEFIRYFSAGKAAGTRPAFKLLWLPPLLIGLGLLAWESSQIGPDTFSMSRVNLDTFLRCGPLHVLAYNLLQYGKLFLWGGVTTSFHLLPLPLGWAYGYLIFPLFALATTIGIFTLRNNIRLLGLFFALAMLTAILWMPPNGRYLYPAAPGLCLLAALAVEAIGQRVQGLPKYVATTLLALLLLWWAGVSFGFAYSSQKTQQRVAQAVEQISEQVQARPNLKRLFLMNLWPPMVCVDRLLPRLLGRPELPVYILTYSSSLYVPETSPLLQQLGKAIFPVEERWREPLQIETQKLEENIFTLKSEPVGFFAGPAAFGWALETLPMPSRKSIRMPDFSVRIGSRSPQGGIRSFLIETDQPLNDPGSLFMQWQNGHMQIWKP